MIVSHLFSPSTLIPAASAGVALYGKQIVILKEEGVTFGSDFDAYVRITFEKDKLDAKGLEIMQEIINMGFLKWSSS